MICTQLGYKGVEEITDESVFGSNGVFGLGRVQCTGSEQSLSQCTFNKDTAGLDDECEAVGLRCSELISSLCQFVFTVHERVDIFPIYLQLYNMIILFSDTSVCDECIFSFIFLLHFDVLNCPPPFSFSLSLSSCLVSY